MKRALFIVYTPFQLINALNIINDFDNNYISDICFMHNNVENFRDQVSKRINGNIFCPHELYDVTPNYGNFRNHIAVLKNIIRKKIYFKKNEVFRDHYDFLFVPSDDSSCRVIYYHLKRQYNISLILFDDGVGTYSGYLFKKRIVLGQLLYGLILEKKFYEYVKEVYCYCPDLFNQNPYNYKIKKIVYKNQNFIFEPTLSNSVNAYIGKKIIFLDQGISTNENIKKTLDILAEISGKESIIVKKHPRVNGINIYDGLCCSQDGLPFEALATTLNCENCLVIAHSSTACVMPFILSKVNYCIITLFSLDDDVPKDNFFCRINSCFNKDLVYMPNTLEELTVYLKENLPHIVEIQPNV